ncbi:MULTISPECIES: hypothetical protein [unclassified Methanoregula]|uniref:hypothetical protein n=1 Tax=unclassified Methanoregula TaxID=2649730 RepID=UPI0009CC53EC|nr:MULTISPECIES: hypothetical protein [unclassified Methanoregula]OPX65295.1 MAG: hypothetical protein A4E33_00328 [Methanoregula sp. PtaB.Bin085]OPY32204.1 MAG: hypothetical protein A4E34_02578 [Methanoregula sp. PtaU1.Bin006]
MSRKKNKIPSENIAKEPDESSGVPSGTMQGQKILLVILVLGIVITGAVVLIGSQPSTPIRPFPKTDGSLTVWYFYGNGCEHCENVTPYVQSLQRKYKDVDFRILEIYDNPGNRDKLLALNRQYRQTSTGIPVAFVGNVVLLGADEIPAKLESAILRERG